MTNTAALISSSALVSAITEASGATLEALAPEVFRGKLRQGPLSVTILPTYDAETARVVFTRANGYYGIEDVEREYADAATASADVLIFFATGAL